MENNDSPFISMYPNSEEEIKMVIEWKKKLKILKISYKKRILEIIKHDNNSLDKKVKNGN